MNSKKTFTPIFIAEDSKKKYSIPIYQRLFEWKVENIKQLLSDLLNAWKENPGGPYYIGILTAKHNTNTDDTVEIIDGQQRLTMLMLLGSVCSQYYPEWEKVVCLSDGKSRLVFNSRGEDNKYLEYIIKSKGVDSGNELQYENIKMKDGAKAIKVFFDKLPEEDRKPLAEYIYNHLSFFISELPVSYTPRDLNIYFERMNCSGKNLEDHEILKVKMLSNLGDEAPGYINLWNRLADVDTPLVDTLKGKRESKGLESFKRELIAKAANADIGYFIDLLANSDTDKLANNDADERELKRIEANAKHPNYGTARIHDNYCVVSFPSLLLLALYWHRKGNLENGYSRDKFFNELHLQETFKTHLPFEGQDAKVKEIKRFVSDLLFCRLVLDICFIRRTTDSDYALDMGLSSDESNVDLKTLLMFESMLYASSSNVTNYKWFDCLMNAVKENQELPTPKVLYEKFYQNDKNEHELPSYDEMSYGKIDRYWFWRLDFYIWQHREAIFKDDAKAKKVADSYIFKRNRSIEHIAPQHPKQNSSDDLKWEDKEEDRRIMNSFGNLAMISQGLNSSLSNSSYTIKKATVEAYCKGEKGNSSIESLKLLVAFRVPVDNESESPGTWNKTRIENHGKEMYEDLKKI